MRIVILGASRFGETIAETLIDAEHEVVLIDKDGERLSRLANRLDCGMLEGDGTLPTTLREAYRDEADVFVSVTNASEDNILAALVARSVGYGRVIPQIVSSELLKVCHELDLVDVINPHASVAQDFVEALQDRDELDHDTALRNQLALKRVHVTRALAGGTIGSLDLPEGVRAIALIRDDDEHHATEDLPLQADDHLLLVMDRERLDDVSRLFRGEA